ncbi:MAG: aminomethyltransferase beta-barrel domain-containing protein [Paracoccus sp. (in: a-proteobacteria)]
MPFSGEIAIQARIRSTRPPRPAILRVTGRAEVELLAPEEGVSPGQACVFFTRPKARGFWAAADRPSPRR